MERHEDLSSALSSAEQDIILRNATLSCVEYLALSALATTLSGTDGTSETGSAFKFEAKPDSNISVTISAGVI